MPPTNRMTTTVCAGIVTSVGFGAGGGSTGFGGMSGLTMSCFSATRGVGFGFETVGFTTAGGGFDVTGCGGSGVGSTFTGSGDCGGIGAGAGAPEPRGSASDSGSVLAWDGEGGERKATNQHQRRHACDRRSCVVQKLLRVGGAATIVAAGAAVTSCTTVGSAAAGIPATAATTAAGAAMACFVW